MHEIEEFVDQRQSSWCIHCGRYISDVVTNRDHVPSKSLLTKSMRGKGQAYDRGEGDPGDYLPQVVVCRGCNAGFSVAENYLLCVLHATMAGSLYPDPSVHPDAANVLRSNRNVVRSLKAKPDGQLFLFSNLEPFVIYPDLAPIRTTVLKNARGHVFHEVGEPMLSAPDYVAFAPLQDFGERGRAAFENEGTRLDLWPEVGSRMLLRVLDDPPCAGGWITVEENRYRYLVDWTRGMTVKTVIWEYLATETCWVSDGGSEVFASWMETRSVDRL